MDSQRDSLRPKTNKYYKTELGENKDNAKYRKKTTLLFLLMSSERKERSLYSWNKTECHLKKHSNKREFSIVKNMRLEIKMLVEELEYRVKNPSRKQKKKK